jgi:parallel beta-helix repeat protein
LTTTTRNIISNNHVDGNGQYGIRMSGSNDNTIMGNSLRDNGDVGNNNAIYLNTSNSNQLTGNTITDSSATTTNYAINISDSASATNYLADNTLGGGSVNDVGIGTIYSGQLNSSGHFLFKAADARIGLGTTMPAYALDVAGEINSETGFLFNGVAGVSITCSAGQFLQNQVVRGGIVTGGTCATAGGGGSYVSLQTGTPGTADTGHINVTGTIIGAILQANTRISAPLLDTASASALAIGTTNATSINLNQNTTVLAGKTLTVGTGSNGVIMADTGITLAGTARGTKTITLIPEYPGATFRGDGTNNTGSLSSDFCSATSGGLSINTTVCSSANQEYNYYEWANTQATAQDYDIYVRYQIPSNYSTGSMTNLKFTGHGTTSGEAATLTMYQGSTQCSTTGDVVTAAGWSTGTVASPLGTCTFAANGYVTFKIQLSATQNNQARAGLIEFTYRNTF